MVGGLVSGMSVSKKHLADPNVRMKVAARYQQSLATMTQLAREEGLTVATVMEILRLEIEPETLRRLKALKYSASKLGEKNPMLGKTPSNAKGDCEDGHGYLTRVVRGKRYFVHRIVMAEMLGLPVEQLPLNLDVHHIDENPQNNEPDNLALTTATGHQELHRRYVKSAQELELRGLSLAGAIQYMISK